MTCPKCEGFILNNGAGPHCVNCGWDEWTVLAFHVQSLQELAAAEARRRLGQRLATGERGRGVSAGKNFRRSGF